MGKRDVNAFRERFQKWKSGELVYDKGRPITDDQYIEIMERVASENNPKWNKYRRNDGYPELSEDEELRRILNDNSYDYRGYYNKYPNSRVNADTHWTDEFKTAYHPTFSVQSKYSGKKSLYNPEGVLGGQWLPNGTYVPAWGQRLPSQKLRLPGFYGGTEGEKELDEYDFAPLLMDEIIVTPTKNIHDVGWKQDMIPNNYKLQKDQLLMQQAMNKRANIARAIWDVGNYALMVADPVPLANTAIGLYNLFRHPIQTSKLVLQFIDRGFNSASNFLNQRHNTLTRMIGTGDSGYKDALTSGIIRGNITPPQYTAKQLSKITPKLKKIGLDDYDIRSFASNYITNEGLWNRIYRALYDISDKPSNSSKISLLARDYTLGIGKSYTDYLTQLEKQKLFSRVDSYGKNMFTSNSEVNGWLKNWRDNPLATFALEDEKLLNVHLFPGDYAVLINGADYYARKATSLGHFSSHPTTFKPIEFYNPSVSFYKAQPGLFTKTKYMKRLTPEQVMIDFNRYLLGLLPINWTKHSINVPNISKYTPLFNLTSDVLNNILLNNE